ncbi:TPA: arginine--tRNA ligase [Candidatus Bathyarchaeota archaeon]|nr:arginine--tRNA ligase [Candidatus Bathyarchaeota archaeon]
MRVAENPFAEFRKECEDLLLEAIKSHQDIQKLIDSDTELSEIINQAARKLNIPPNPKFGQLSSSISFQLSKRLKIKPQDLAYNIVGKIDSKSKHLVSNVVAESGYINFYVDIASLADLTLSSAKILDRKFGFVKTDKVERILVEHTSVNPIHPMHIGHARNSVLGDALARILKARGYQVSRHYYVDDVGRQSAIVAYGYKLLDRPSPKGKPDHFIGAIYSLTSCFLEIRRLKEEISRLKKEGRNDEIRELNMELHEWVSVAADLEKRYPEIFERLLDAMNRIQDPEGEIKKLIRNYEAGDEEARILIRRVCEICLQGFMETLKRADITFDSWDWESSLLWSGETLECVRKLEETPYVYRERGALEFDAEKVARRLNLKSVLGLRDDYEIPSLTLTRADGTTLYPTRDIAYSIWKFRRADKVINVVGMEQRLAQLQLKLALYALGYFREAERLIHFAYNLVRTPGYKMSGRRGRYITFDRAMDEAVRIAFQEVSKRSPSLPEDLKIRISESIGIGAVKYALVSTDPAKPVIFTWDRILDFERNTAPYLQYTHARACSILKKSEGIEERTEANYSLLSEDIERDLVLSVSRFPEFFVEAAENLKPNLIAEFVYTLADNFNTFYASLPVLKAEPPQLREARLRLVDAVRIVIRNSLNVLGIEAPERM